MKAQSAGLQIPPHCITGAVSWKGAKDKDLRAAFREREGNTEPWKNLQSASLHQWVLGSLKNTYEMEQARGSPLHISDGHGVN